VLGAGETRTLRLRLPVAERLTVYADEVLADGHPIDLAVVSTAHCAGVAEPSPSPTPGGSTAAAGATVTDPHAAGAGGDPDRLAATGSAPLVPVIGLGAALLLAGSALLAASRRRPRTR
jgi:hypothetical protein